MKRKFFVGQELVWIVREFDGETREHCKVTEIHDDHVIAEGNGMTLWIDGDNEMEFFDFSVVGGM